jgi:DNA-binding NarL/FixJ family response regulator
MRDGLKAILNSSGEFQVAYEAENGPDAIQMCKGHQPDMVILEIDLLGLNGILTTSEILRQCGDVKIVILSTRDDETSVVGAIRAGAKGFVPKKASGSDLLDALRKVAAGGCYVGSKVMDHVMRRILDRNPVADPLSPTLDVLAPREMQVLCLVAEGMTNKEIAGTLSLSVETVRSYRKTTLKKLGVSNTAGLTRVAMTAGITSHKLNQYASQTPVWGASGAIRPIQQLPLELGMHRASTRESSHGMAGRVGPRFEGAPELISTLAA